MLKVRIAELNRSAMRQVGVSWLDGKNQSIIGSTINSSQAGTSISGAVGGGSGGLGQMVNIARNPLNHQGGGFVSSFNASGSAGSGSSQLFGIFNAGQFSLFINALRSNRLAKLLAEPNLMALDGQPARFLAGGLFPYPVPQSSSIPGGTAVVTVQFANVRGDPSVPAAHPGQRRDPARRRAGLQPAQLRGGHDDQRRPGAGDRPAERADGGRAPRRPDAGDRRPAPDDDQRRPRSGSRASATCRSSAPGSATNTIETVETELVVLVTPELVAPDGTSAMRRRCPATGCSSRTTTSSTSSAGSRASSAATSAHGHRARPADVMKHFQSENLGGRPARPRRLSELGQNADLHARSKEMNDEIGDESPSSFARCWGWGPGGSRLCAGDEPIVVRRPGPPTAHFHRRNASDPSAGPSRGRTAVHEHFIGNPEEFIEPPLGFYLYENINMMKAGADPHQFTLYTSDFVPGGDRLTLAGTKRLNNMARRLPKWMGPMLIEWTPDEPELAEAQQEKDRLDPRQREYPMVPERSCHSVAVRGAVRHRLGQQLYDHDQPRHSAGQRFTSRRRPPPPSAAADNADIRQGRLTGALLGSLACSVNPSEKNLVA